MTGSRITKAKEKVFAFDAMVASLVSILTGVTQTVITRLIPSTLSGVNIGGLVNVPNLPSLPDVSVFGLFAFNSLVIVVFVVVLVAMFTIRRR